MKINGNITMLFSADGMEIEVRDVDANVHFLKLKLDSKQTCLVLSRMGHVKVESCEVMGLNKVGKVHECKSFKFELENFNGYEDRKKVASKRVLEVCPAGWEPDLYFGSQDSFFYKDDKPWARTTIRRWVDKEDK